MSDISKSSSSSSIKRRINIIDDDLECLSQEANNLNDFVYKTEFECSLMTLKMKREKVKALSAFARSQVLLTEMEILIAEGDLYTDIERLRNSKRIKLERDEGKLRKDSPQEKVSKSVQATESKDKKKRKHSSRTSSGDDETVIIPTIHVSPVSTLEASQTSKTGIQSVDLFGISPTNQSDSEVSLSNSIKDEFNEPYISKQMQDRVKKSPAKKIKSTKKAESKNKSKNAVKRTESVTDRPQTPLADPRCINTPPNLQNAANNSRTTSENNIFLKTIASSTYVPGRHNMPPVLTQYFNNMQNS